MLLSSEQRDPVLRDRGSNVAATTHDVGPRLHTDYVFRSLIWSRMFLRLGSSKPMGLTRVNVARSLGRQVGGFVASMTIFPPNRMTVTSSPIRGTDWSSG